MKFAQPLKETAKRLLGTVTPGLLNTVRAIRHRRYFRREFGSLHQQAHELFYQNGDILVLSGPFKGLRYFNEIVWGPITPKWIGSYEFELAGIVEEIAAKNYAVVIDIGCAEGYYAVGLASRLPQAQVFAFDIDFISRGQVRRLAQLNGVASRVVVCSYCAAEDISRLASGRTLVVCDIEGFERSLLDPVACPTLRSVDILVEVHEEQGQPSVLDLLKARFAPSHRIREVVSSDRRAWVSEMTASHGWTYPEARLYEAAHEHRAGEQRWLWLQGSA